MFGLFSFLNHSLLIYFGAAVYNVAVWSVLLQRGGISKNQAKRAACAQVWLSLLTGPR